MKKPRKPSVYYVRHAYSASYSVMKLLKKQPTAHDFNTFNGAPHVYFIEAASAQEALWLMWTQAVMLGKQPQRRWLNEASVWLYRDAVPDSMRLYIQPPEAKDGFGDDYMRRRAVMHGAKIVPRNAFWEKWKKKGFYAPRRKRG